MVAIINIVTDLHWSGDTGTGMTAVKSTVYCLHWTVDTETGVVMTRKIMIRITYNNIKLGFFSTFFKILNMKIKKTKKKNKIKITSKSESKLKEKGGRRN